MKTFLLGVLVGIAVPVVGAFGYLRLGMAEVRADIAQLFGAKDQYDNDQQDE